MVTGMPKQIYDVIVIGTGAGGGTAIKTLCEAGLKVCALNAGRRLDPKKDFRNHRMPWDMKFRGSGDPAKRSENIGFMDSEYVEGVWDHEIKFTTAPGTGVRERRVNILVILQLVRYFQDAALGRGAMA